MLVEQVKRGTTMSDYSKISSYIGSQHWQNCITHDNGQFAQDGGGKSTLLLGQPGKGKTTLLCYKAQLSRCMHHGSKIPFIGDIIEERDLSGYAGKIFQETVIWRARDMDSFANVIPCNWSRSFGGSMGSIKDVYLWIHEADKQVIFYSYNHKRQEMCIDGLPAPQFYSCAEDLLARLHWGAINVVLEPQTYHLSPTLIQRLREKKMDISDEDDRENERVKLRKQKGKSYVKKSTRNVQTEYEKREVSSSYFWFDMIHVAKSQNKDRHIHFILDEVDDIFEARSEGDVWKLIEMLANDWKDLRKHNISTSLSTHEIDFIDWRILPRIDYIVWMTGARIHSRSSIKVQALVSNLPIGLFLIEQRGITFGKKTFEKIPKSQPAVRIDGLKGEDFVLTDSVANRIMEEYAQKWGVVRDEKTDVPHKVPNEEVTA
jgi:hypothetical protein